MECITGRHTHKFMLNVAFLTSVSLTRTGGKPVRDFFSCRGVLDGVGSRCRLSTAAEPPSSVSTAVSWSFHLCSTVESCSSRVKTVQHFRQTRDDRCGVSFKAKPSFNNCDATFKSLFSNINLLLLITPPILRFVRQSLQQSFTAIFVDLTNGESCFTPLSSSSSSVGDGVFTTVERT